LRPLPPRPDAGRALRADGRDHRAVDRPRPPARGGTRLNPARRHPMAIDFTLPPDVVRVRERVRDFMRNEVAPAEARFASEGGWRKGLATLREQARAAGLWAPHMPPDYGGMGLGPLAFGGDERHGEWAEPHAAVIRGHVRGPEAR